MSSDTKYFSMFWWPFHQNLSCLYLRVPTDSPHCCICNIDWGPHCIHCLATECRFWTPLQQDSCGCWNMLLVFLRQSDSWGSQLNCICIVVAYKSELFISLDWRDWEITCLVSVYDSCFSTSTKMRCVAYVVALLGGSSVMMSQSLS